MEKDVPGAEPASSPESARTSTRTSARNPSIELITRNEPRRRWSIEQKQAIAAESLAPGASPTAVARRYGISSGLLYAWRKALLAVQPCAMARFARVEVTAAGRRAGSAVPAAPLLPAPQAPEMIEIVLVDGTTLRASARIDPRTLRGLLSALRR
jgi:transposase